MLSTVSFKNEVIETPLSESQIKSVRKAYKESSYLFADRVFGKGNYRLVYDIGVSNKNKDNQTDDEIFGSNADYTSVKDFLSSHNYKIKDYGKGICILDGDAREFKIGRVLNRYKASDEIKKNFENGISRENAKNALSPMKVMISRNPYDVAAMSTGRGWSSCMSLSDGCNREYVMRDVAKGTCVAYLFNSNDTKFENPTSRLLLKKFKKNNSRKRADHVLVPEVREYGSRVPEFKSFVKKWADENFPINEDCILNFQTGLYNDGIGDNIHYVSINSSKIKSEDVNDRVYAARYGSDAVRLLLINDKSTSVIDTILRYTNDPSIVVSLILGIDDPKDYLINNLDKFNIHIPEHAACLKRYIHNNIDRKYARPAVKHFESSQSGIDFYLSEEFDNMAEAVCRHGNNDIVRAFVQKYPSTYNRIEVARRVPRQLTEEILTDILSSVGIMGAYAILKHDCLGSVDFTVDGKKPADYLIGRFEGIEKLVKKYGDKVEPIKVMEKIKEDGKELSEDEFIKFLKK